MSEATKDTKQSLDASVAALVGESAPAPAPADSNGIDLEGLAAEAVADMMSSEHQAPKPPAAPPAAPDPALAQAVDELVAPPAPVHPQSAVAEDPADLAKAVEKLFQEEAAKAEAPAGPPPQKIETLDAKIADLADDMIAGELADEQNVLQGEVGGPPIVETPPPPAGTERPAEKAPESAPHATAPKAAEPAPVVEPVKLVPIAPIAKPPAPRPAPTTRQTAERAAKVAARHGAVAARILKPQGLKLLQLMSGPLRNKPKYVRDLVGWVAIITLFNASCLWMYVLFFRSAKAPEPAAAVVKTESSHEKGKEDAGHGEKKAEKKDDKKSSSKTDKPKKPPPKKDAKADAAKSHGTGH